MFLVIGLGNPEKKYFTTRHNIGFLAVDALAQSLGTSWKKKTDLFAEIAEVQTGETKIILAKPQTYMNESGKAVAALAHRFHIEPHHIIVISDDVALPFGTIRTRTEGSAGGHNGLKSIIAHMGTQQFLRVRVGVDTQPAHVPLENWVLSTFTPEEQKTLPAVITHAAEITFNIVRGKIPLQTTHALPSSPAS